MIKNFFLGFILSLIFSLNDAQLNSVSNSQLDSYPEQIHLSYGLPDQMIGMLQAQLFNRSQQNLNFLTCFSI